jgi:SAM-dependent methyltransferase
MKCFNRLAWGLSDDVALIDSFLSYLPSEFDGVLLDVPVGTGVFTLSPYARFPNATIVAVDYSMGMLREARKRFQEHGMSNVHLVRADIANLPVRDGAVDQVVSMNGLHAFPNKQRAVAEMRRVLREQGTLVACSYVSGARWLTDLIIKLVHVRRGFFSPPFFHVDDIDGQLEGFTISRQDNLKYFAWFEAVKDHAATSPATS